MPSRVTRRQARPCYAEATESSSDEEPAASGSKQKRRKMPARGTRCQKKLAESSENSSHAKEEDEESEASDEEDSVVEQLRRSRRSSRPANSNTTKRTQPSRAARRPLPVVEILSSEDEDQLEESFEEETAQTTRRRNRSSQRVQRTPRKRKRSQSAAKSKPTRPQMKSPAVKHAAKRHATPTSHCASDCEPPDSSANEEESDEVFDADIKIQKIIASRTETRQRWMEICSKINTSEIDDGSRWFQEDKDDKIKNSDQMEERYLVKWAGLSFLHCSWETMKDLKKLVQKSSTHIRNFLTKCPSGLYYSAEERGDGDYFDPSYVEIDRILKVEKDTENCGVILDKNHRKYEHGTGRQFLIKWVNLSYTDISYEFERDLIMNDVSYEEHLDSYLKRSVKPSKTTLTRGDSAFRRLYISMFGQNAKGGEDREAKLKEFQDSIYKIDFKNGGKLRDYQAEGVTWMLSNYLENRSMILADEMGLGKTIQTATYINYIATNVGKRGPFLIIAPLSTLPHWKREFDRWTDLNTVVYSGTADDRVNIRELEFAFEEDRPKDHQQKQKYLAKCHHKGSKTWMVQVVITTPEYLITDDSSELQAVDWEVLVVDEAHRLKNHSAKLAINLRKEGFRFSNILCLTGTPIQNTVNELWALLNFIDSSKFCRLESFLEKFGGMKTKEVVNELHELIRPYILRRLKEDVEKSVPPKEETIIEVELTSLQKRYYRALYEKNVQYLNKNKKALDIPSLSNLAMQLRKCCNSAFLVNGVESEFRNEEIQSKQYTDELDFLMKSSGKLVLLHKLLPKLKEEGHKILIFSQFKVMLDIIEDYLCLTPYKFERIDGGITGIKRQSAIDRFQGNGEDGKESPFIMLLTTKAGGVGINLTAADVCIIWDSDYNPQNDLQAQARCHRIGQTKSVTIYRLLTRKTYEQQLFHMASVKMGLDTAVLHGVENKSSSKAKVDLTKDEVERLLRHGAYDIFNEEKNGTSEEESKRFQEANIDEIMAQRAKKIIHDNTGSHSNAAGGTFSKATFKLSFAKDPSSTVSEAECVDIDIDDPDFWVKMVGVARMDSTPIIAKRPRAKLNYCEEEIDENSSSSSASTGDSSSSSDNSFDLSGEEILKEPKRWGGKSPGEWRKKEFKEIVKMLRHFGYTNCYSNSVLSKLILAHGENEVKRMVSSVLLFTLKEAAEVEAKMPDNNVKNRKDPQGLQKMEEIDFKLNDPKKVEKELPGKNLNVGELALAKSYLALVEKHQSLLSRVLEDVACWATNHSARSMDSTFSVASHDNSFFSEWGFLTKFLMDYAPSQLAYNRSKTCKMPLKGNLLDVCSLVHKARQYVSEADEVYEDPSKRRNIDKDLNIAVLLNIHVKTISMPCLGWETRHDGVLVRAIAKHGWPNSRGVYNTFKTDTSLRWKLLPAEVKSEHCDGTKKTEKIQQLKETAREAMRLLSSDDEPCFDINRLSKMLCLKKKSEWILDEEEISQVFDFNLPPNIHLVTRAQRILGMDTDIKTNYGLTEIDQSNPRNILLKEIMLWLVSSRISSNVQGWMNAAAKAEAECKRLASQYSDKSMLLIYEHIRAAVNVTGSALIKSSRLVKNVLRAILGLELSFDMRNPDLIFPLMKENTRSLNARGNDGTGKSQKVLRVSWAESALYRSSQRSALRIGLENSPDVDSKYLLLTLLEEQVLKVLISHGIPVWEEGTAKLADDDAPQNEVSWDKLSEYLDSSMKACLENCVTRLDAAKIELQQADMSSIYEESKKQTLQERYNDAVMKVESMKSILSENNALRSCPKMFGKKAVMLLLAVLAKAEMKEYGSKGRKMGKIVEVHGIGIIRWGQIELNKWAESLECRGADTRSPVSTLAVDCMQNQSELFSSVKLDKKACRIIHCQVFQQTRLRSIMLSHVKNEFSQLVFQASRSLEKNGKEWPGCPVGWENGVDDLELIYGILLHGYGCFEMLIQSNSSLNKMSLDAGQTRLVQLSRELHCFRSSHDRWHKSHSTSFHAPFDSSKPIAKKQTLIGTFFSSGQPATTISSSLNNAQEKHHNKVGKNPISSGTNEKISMNAPNQSPKISPNKKVKLDTPNRKHWKCTLRDDESVIELLSTTDDSSTEKRRTTSYQNIGLSRSSCYMQDI